MLVEKLPTKGDTRETKRRGPGHLDHRGYRYHFARGEALVVVEECFHVDDDGTGHWRPIDHRGVVPCRRWWWQRDPNAQLPAAKVVAP
jgi:hypothetical protein